jgi:EmrB/QacA subfamily drug resistance transporter
MQNLQHRQKIGIMLAIMAAVLFTAINQIIVGIALPAIISDLGGLDYFSWIFTAYMLAACVVTVIAGRLSDVYGRKPFILTGVIVLLVGSILAGTATDVIELIIYRVIQGVGGGLILASCFTAVGDLFPTRERARWQGLLGASYGLASVLAPPMGGFISDHWHWKWVFWIFTPIGFLALILILFLYPSMEKKQKQKQKQSIDYVGAALLIITMITSLLTFSWAGRRFDWDSPEILSLLVSTIFSSILLLLTERRTEHPIIPLPLFRNSTFVISILVTFLMGASTLGSLLFMPIYLQGILGLSATSSGTIMMIMTLCLVAASVLCGQLVSRSGKYKNIAIFGLLITSIGIYLLSTLTAQTDLSTILTYLALVGVGIGIALPLFNLTIQNSVDHKNLGIATAVGQLFRQLGASIGVALMGNLMSYNMYSELAKRISHITSPQVISVTKGVINRMDIRQLSLINPGKFTELNLTSIPDAKILQEVVITIRESLNIGLSYVFIGSALPAFVAILLVIFLREIPLRITKE